MHTLRVTVGILAALILATPLCAQGSATGWDRYTPGRLRTIVDAHRDAIAEGALGGPADSVRFVSAEDFPTEAKLLFVGETRPLPRLKREFLVEWLRFIGKDTATAQLYAEELLFREDSAEYWLPVQKGMPEWVRENVQPGQLVSTFVMFLGALRIPGKLEWMFIVTGI